MPSLASGTFSRPDFAVDTQLNGCDGATAPEDAAQAFLSVNSPGRWNDRADMSRQGAAVSASMPANGAASLYLHGHVDKGDRTPEPLVSIQLADDDDDASITPAKSGGTKNSIYRRVWGSGPSPILQRQFQRYSLRGKLNKSIGDRYSVADSPAGRKTPLAAASLRPSQDTQPTDQSFRESSPAGASTYKAITARQRAGSNAASSSSGGMFGNRAYKTPGLNSSSDSPAAAARTPEPRTGASPAAASSTRTPDPRICTSPVLPSSTVNRTPARRAGASPAPAAAVQTPETRIPRVAYLTPAGKSAVPGSAIAYRTTASSPGPNPLTPLSSMRPSPHLGSGCKPVQYQPRGLAVLRYTAAASASGSAAWAGISPARSDVVATPDPGMARTLDGLLLAEDLLAELVARAVELVESGGRPGAPDGAGAAPTRRLFMLDVVSEADRADSVSEGSEDAAPGCRCTIM